MGDIPLQRWNTSDWKIFFGDRGPKIREITECLGLSCDSNHGILKFSEPESNKLSERVQELSKDLPKDLNGLLTSASRPDSLDKELNELLSTFGPAIWGKDVNDRKRLLLAPRSKRNYSRDLFYEVPEDREILKIHLHRWIYREAGTHVPSRPSRKLTRNSAARGSRMNPGIDAEPFMVGSTSPPAEALRPGALGDTIAPVPASAQQTNTRKRNADTHDWIGPTEKRPSRNANCSVGEIPNEPLFTIQSPGNSYQSPYTSTLTPPPRSAQNEQHNSTNPRPTHAATSPTLVALNTPGNHHHTPEHPRSSLSENQVLPLSQTGVLNPHPTMGHRQDSSERNRMSAPREVTLKQCELLRLLLEYLLPRDGNKPDEFTLLKYLEEIWTDHETEFRLAMEPLFDCHREVLLVWINEQRKISQLRVMIECQSSVQTMEMVDRVLAINDLRIFRLRWKALNAHHKNQDLSPENLLCRTFAMMTKTEGTEYLFKEGLDRLTEIALSIMRPEGLAILI